MIGTGRIAAAFDVVGLVALLAWVAVGVGFGIVKAASGDDAVVVMVTGPGERGREPRATIKAGGFIDYAIVTEQREACPGDAVNTFRSVTGDDPVVVTTRRGAKPGPVNEPTRYVVSVQVPPSVTPGVWIFESGRDSRCPLRQRYDPLATMLLEVTP